MFGRSEYYWENESWAVERGQSPERQVAWAGGRDIQPVNQENIKLMWRQKKWGSSIMLCCVFYTFYPVSGLSGSYLEEGSSWHQRGASLYWQSSSDLSILRALPELHESELAQSVFLEPHDTFWNRRTFLSKCMSSQNMSPRMQTLDSRDLGDLTQQNFGRQRSASSGERSVRGVARKIVKKGANRTMWDTQTQTVIAVSVAIILSMKFHQQS